MPIIRNRKNGPRSWSINCPIGRQEKRLEGQLIQSQTRLKQQLLLLLRLGKNGLCPRKMTGWFIFNIRKTIQKGENGTDNSVYFDWNWEAGFPLIPSLHLINLVWCVLIIRFLIQNNSLFWAPDFLRICLIMLTMPMASFIGICKEMFWNGFVWITNWTIKMFASSCCLRLWDHNRFWGSNYNL